MKIAILTSHFPPDRSAGSFRMAALAERIIDLKLDDQVIFLTRVPNRYNVTINNTQRYDLSQNVKVIKVKNIFQKVNGIYETLNYGYYFLYSIVYLTFYRPNLIFATSSKFFTAVLGFLGCKKDTIFILEYRDLFWENIRDLYNLRTIAKIGMQSEKLVLRRANKISIVSKGFQKYMESSGTKADLGLFPNGIDKLFVDNRKKNLELGPLERETVKILYAGNIGSGQGLDRILPDFASEHSNVDFSVIGTGRSEELLRSRLRDLSVNNVRICGPISREELVNRYNDTDILFLHLHDAKSFERVLPSKIFEYAATGKPILAGVSGEAARFLKQHVVGSFVFDAEDLRGMETALQALLTGQKFYEREKFISDFSREKIMNDLIKFIGL